MNSWLREAAASIVCTILLVPLSLIGILIGMVLYFIYNNVLFLNIPDWLNLFAPAFIGGVIAGLGATYISVRFIKPQRRKVFLALPLIVMGIAIIGGVLAVAVLGKPWLNSVEPTSNAIGAVIGLLYMSKDMFSQKSVQPEPEGMDT